MEIIVIGCGVSGLTCGIRLREAGFGVRIWARDVPPNTTSDIAGAIWYPFEAFPLETVGRWAAHSFEDFSLLSRRPGTGVAMRRSIENLSHAGRRSLVAPAGPTLPARRRR